MIGFPHDSQNPLQWGRELSPAEIAFFPKTRSHPSRLQWGRELSPAEI